jgi:hypothetical protein
MMEEFTDSDDPFLEEILLLAMKDRKTQVIKFMKRTEVHETVFEMQDKELSLVLLNLAQLTAAGIQ